MAEFTYDAAPRPRTPALDGLITAILGGTGEQGRGLARRLAMAGHPVIISSRSRNRARATVQEVGHGICGLANRDAIREANLMIALLRDPRVIPAHRFMRQAAVCTMTD